MGNSATKDGWTIEDNPERKHSIQDRARQHNGPIASDQSSATPALKPADGNPLDVNHDTFSSVNGTGQWSHKPDDGRTAPTDLATLTSQPSLPCIDTTSPSQYTRQAPQTSADSQSLHSPFAFQKSKPSNIRINALPSSSSDEQQSDIHSPSTIQSTNSSVPSSRSRAASNSAQSIATSVTSAGTSHSSASEFLETLKQRQDIRGRRRNPKLARVSNWSDPHYTSEIVPQCSSTSSQPLAKAYGKRAVGRSTLPLHITQSVLSTSSNTSSSPCSDRGGCTRSSTASLRSCLSSTASNQPKRPQYSPVSFAADIPPVPEVPLQHMPHVSRPINVPSSPQHLEDVKNASAPASVQNHTAVNDAMEHSTADLVPLSDACPFLSGPTHLRDRLDRTAPYHNGYVKIEQLLRQRGVDPGQVSRRDWTLVWHLSMTEASGDVKPKDVSGALLMIPTFFFWLRSATEMERVHLTVDDFVKWVQSKQEGERLFYHWGILAAEQRTKPHVRAIEDRGKGSESELKPREGRIPAPSASNPVGIWSEIYQLLRSRGMYEKRMEKEDLAHLILLPREERHSFLDTLAAKQKPLTSDDASDISSTSSFRSIAVSSSASNQDKTRRRAASIPSEASHPEVPITRTDWAKEEAKILAKKGPTPSEIQAPDRLWAHHNSIVKTSKAAKPIMTLPPAEDFMMTKPTAYGHVQDGEGDGQATKTESKDLKERKKKKGFGAWLSAKLQQSHLV